MKKLFLFFVLVCAVVLSAGEKLPKYIILFIGDGMSTPQRMMAEEFSRKTGKGELVINHFPFHASTRTVSTSSLVTDSAAAGTAIACGTKTANGRIGVAPDGRTRFESVAELAKKKNYKVGIVTTVTINHATPASFYGHRISRSQYYELGVDLVNSNFDYFAGGGVAFPTGRPAKKGAPLPNLPNIYDLAAKKGYKVLKDKKAFMALKPGSGKILYSGAPGRIPAAIDAGKEDITLAELTAKGLELLKNDKGFFLMVEGGTIDGFGHANEAASNLREVLALDDAVKEAVKFMKKHPQDTLIVVTGDHETGGMSMGFAGSGYAMHMERLALQKVSIGKFASLLKDARQAKKDFSYADAQKMITKYFGLQFTGNPKKDPMALSAEQKKALEAAYKKNRLPGALKTVMNQKAGIGWTTGAHTALPVLTTATGVQAKRFSGFIDNTDIARTLKSLLK